MLRHVVGELVVGGHGARDEEGLARVDQVRVGDLLVVLVVDVAPVGGLVVEMLGDRRERVAAAHLVVAGLDLRRVPGRGGGRDGDGAGGDRVECRRGLVRSSARRAAVSWACVVTVVGLSGAANACCADGTATSAPAMATAGAALPACAATFSTCEGVECLPRRLIFTSRRSLCPAVMLSPWSMPGPPTRLLEPLGGHTQSSRANRPLCYGFGWFVGLCPNRTVGWNYCRCGRRLARKSSFFCDRVVIKFGHMWSVYGTTGRACMRSAGTRWARGWGAGAPAIPGSLGVAAGRENRDTCGRD